MVSWGSLPRHKQPDHQQVAVSPPKPPGKAPSLAYAFPASAERGSPLVPKATMAGRPVDLDVGGHAFRCLPATLMDSPYFENLLATREPDEGGGALFIDRDGEPFKYILSFLRTGSLVIAPEAAHMLKAIVLEAEFYGIQALLDDVDARCRAHLLPRDEDAEDDAYEKFEYTYLCAPKAAEGIRGLVHHRCFPECFFRSIKETKIVSLAPAVPGTHVHWISSDEQEHSLPIIAMALVELIYGDSRVEPMVKFENDYAQPISTIPNQHSGHTWWVVKRSVFPMDETMIKNALDRGAAEEGVARLTLDKVPSFLEVSEYEDPKSFAKHTQTSYLGDDFEPIALRRPRFDDRARDEKWKF